MNFKDKAYQEQWEKVCNTIKQKYGDNPAFVALAEKEFRKQAKAEILKSYKDAALRECKRIGL